MQESQNGGQRAGGGCRPSITKGFPRNGVAQRCLYPRTLAYGLPWGREGGGNIGRTCLSDPSITELRDQCGGGGVEKWVVGLPLEGLGILLAWKT